MYFCKYSKEGKKNESDRSDKERRTNKKAYYDKRSEKIMEEVKGVKKERKKERKQ